MTRLVLWMLAGLCALAVPQPALAQDAATPAKVLFGTVAQPAPPPAQAIGFYSKGCLAGAIALPVSGPTWQVMRLSRNRNWGHPELIAFITRFAAEVPRVSSWPGILVGDMAQPRGGPMRTGHASHQLGLDVDIWLTPSPGVQLSQEARETLSAIQMVRDDRLDVNKAVWTADHVAVIRAAASAPGVERVFVNAAIKKALCRDARGDRSWLTKVRPYWGHDFHMHVRLSCPADSPQCRPQESVPDGEGCGAELAWWFTGEVLHPKPPKEPPKPRPPLSLADLPAACAGVLSVR